MAPQWPRQWQGANVALQLGAVVGVGEIFVAIIIHAPASQDVNLVFFNEHVVRFPEAPRTHIRAVTRILRASCPWIMLLGG